MLQINELLKEGYHRNLHTYPGMGLELYISAQIIGRHGGKSGVKSTPATALSSILFYPFISRNKRVLM
jgi:signal transduction histidine kinase